MADRRPWPVALAATLLVLAAPSRSQDPACPQPDTTAGWARVKLRWDRDTAHTWTNDSLRRVLLRLRDADQEARTEFGSRVGDTAYIRRLIALDAASSRELAAIIDRFGLPTKSLVGTAGADAAMLLVQHSATLQERVLSLARAVPPGELSPEALAMLEDRVFANRGQAQRFGTQFTLDADGRFRLAPLASSVNLDARRAAVGLPPLLQYVCMLEESGLRVDRRSLP